MKNRKLTSAVLAITVALAVGATAAAGTGQSTPSPNAVTGSWLVTVNRGPSAPPLSSLQSFTRGGSVIETANTVGNRGPSHGAWRHLNGRLFASTIVFFRFDAQGTFIGSQKIRRTLRLTRDGSSFTAVSISELLDAAGNVIPTPAPLRATEIAQRIAVERIPDVP